MEILCVNNNHIKKNMHKNEEYGCVCPRCGSVFIFKDKEILKPRCINPKPQECTITCPNSECSQIIYLSNPCIKKFENSDDKQSFKNQYDE